jgi:hypothetical protein
MIDYFGMISLSYGFCSPAAVVRAIAGSGGGGIDPKVHQHAAHERNRAGRSGVGPRGVVWATAL